MCAGGDGARRSRAPAPAPRSRRVSHAPPAPSLTLLYLDDFDTTGHELGPDDPRSEAVALELLEAVEHELVDALAGTPGALVLLFADHGQLPTDPERCVYVNERCPQLVPLLRRGADGRPLAPAGSARDLFLHVREGALDDALGLLEQLFGDDAWVVPTAQLAADGVFGPRISARFRERVGDLVVLPRAGIEAWWREPGRFAQKHARPPRRAGAGGGRDLARCARPVTAPALRGGIRPLLFPRSVAVVGASDRTAESAADLQQVLDGGVPTWFVNPNRPSVLGRECFASLTALAEAPECAYLLVGHARAEAAFEDAIAAGVRAVVLPGLGAEAGAEGRAVAARIGARAAESDVAVVGPNCMGIATPGGVSLWLGTVGGPEQFVPGHVSCVAHSGSIGEAFLACGPRVGFRTVVSAGSELSRDIADFVAYLAEDEGTRAIGLFVETIRRPDAFAAALARAAEAAQAGRLPQGRALPGRRARRARPLGRGRRLGARVLRAAAPSRGDRGDATSTSCWRRSRCSAGAAGRAVCALRRCRNRAVNADCSPTTERRRTIPFPPFDDAVQARLIEAFPNFTQPENPLDCWAVDAYEHVFPGTLSILRETGSYDVLLAQLDLSRHRGAHEEGWCAFVTAALADAVEGTAIFPAVTVGTRDRPAPAIAELARDPRRRPAARYARGPAGDRGRRPLERPPAAAGCRSRAPRCPAIHCRRARWPSTTRMRCSSATACASPRPCAAPPRTRRRRRSSCSAGRSSSSWTALPTSRPPAAWRSESRAPPRPATRPSGMGGRVLVARQVPAGVEAFCGLTRDPDYGPVLAVGLGGRALEALGLAAVALAPLDEQDAREPRRRGSGARAAREPARRRRARRRTRRALAPRGRSARRSTRSTSTR